MSNDIQNLINTYKNTHYIFQGETQEELKQKLYLTTSHADDYPPYSPLKPPIGIIFVGNDMSNTWIADKFAFYGWSIHHINTTTDEIKALESPLGTDIKSNK